MFNLPLNNDRLHNEWQTILHITKNKFPITLPHKLEHQIQHRIMHAIPPTNAENNTKWATLTFTSPHTRKITNVLNTLTLAS